MEFNLTNKTLTKSDLIKYVLSDCYGFTKDNAKALEELEAEMDEEDYVECYTFELQNQYDPKLYYDEMWFIDLKYPALKKNINTSSYYAMWSCKFDDCNEDEEPIKIADLIEDETLLKKVIERLKKYEN